jgi:hypothetical protein
MNNKEHGRIATWVLEARKIMSQQLEAKTHPYEAFGKLDLYGEVVETESPAASGDCVDTFDGYELGILEGAQAVNTGNFDVSISEIREMIALKRKELSQRAGTKTDNFT